MPTTAAEAEVFDAATLLGQLGGDAEIATLLIATLRQDMPGLLDQAAGAVARGDWPAAARGAHTIKGLAAQIGAPRLLALARAAHGTLKDGGTIDGAAVAALRSAYAELDGRLAAWLEQAGGAAAGN